MFGVTGNDISISEGERLVPVNSELVAQALLPDNSEVTGAIYDFQRDVLWLRVKHADFQGFGNDGTAEVLVGEIRTWRRI